MKVKKNNSAILRQLTEDGSHPTYSESIVSNSNIRQEPNPIDSLDQDFITTLLTMMQKDFDFAFYKWLRKQGIHKMIMVPELVRKYNVDIKHQEYPFVLDELFIPSELFYLDAIRANVMHYRIRLLIEMPKKPNNRTLKHFKRMINHIKGYDCFRIDLDIHPGFVNAIEWDLICNHIRFAPQKHCSFNFAFLYNLKALYSIEIAQTKVNFKNFTFILKCLNIRILTLIDCEYINIKESSQCSKINLFCLSATNIFDAYTPAELTTSFLTAFPDVSHIFFCGGDLNKIPFHSMLELDWESKPYLESFYYESSAYLDLEVFNELFNRVEVEELKIQMKIQNEFPLLDKINRKALRKCSFIFDIETVHDNEDIKLFIGECASIKSLFLEFGVKLGVILMTKDHEVLLSSNEEYEMIPMTDALYLNLVKTGSTFMLSPETLRYVTAICEFFEKPIPKNVVLS